MTPAFKFLSTDPFEHLGSAYLSGAMEELQRLKAPREDRGWRSLFSQEKPSGQYRGTATSARIGNDAAR